MGGSDRGIIIAKRSVSLTKSYPIIGLFLTFVGLMISLLSGAINSISKTGIAANANSSGSLNLSGGFPFLTVPLQALAAIIFSMPVLLLFVYDKNNGVLEYFLSLGMSQRDVYRQYLKAAVILSSAIVCFDVIIDVAAGLIQKSPGMMFEISGLVVAIALPAVSLQALIMMSFSSLQKQRVGSNQPLGMAMGTFTVLPAYLVPLVIPSLAFEMDLLLASVIIALSILIYLASSRLISREKLLP